MKRTALIVGVIVVAVAWVWRYVHEGRAQYDPYAVEFDRSWERLLAGYTGRELTRH